MKVGSMYVASKKRRVRSGGAVIGNVYDSKQVNSH